VKFDRVKFAKKENQGINDEEKLRGKIERRR